MLLVFRGYREVLTRYRLVPENFDCRRERKYELVYINCTKLLQGMHILENNFREKCWHPPKASVRQQISYQT
jgi:hypothetical protein